MSDHHGACGLLTMPNEILITVIANTEYSSSMLLSYSWTSQHMRKIILENYQQINNMIAKVQFPELDSILEITQHTTKSLSRMKQQDIYMHAIMQHLLQSDIGREVDAELTRIIAGGLLIIARLEAIRENCSTFTSLTYNDRDMAEHILAFVSPLKVLAAIRITCIYIIHCMVSDILTEPLDPEHNSISHVPDCLFTDQAIISLEHIATTEGLATLFVLLKPVDGVYKWHGSGHLTDSSLENVHHNLLSQTYSHSLQFPTYIEDCKAGGYLRSTHTYDDIIGLPGPFPMYSSLQLSEALWYDLRERRNDLEHLGLFDPKISPHSLVFGDVALRVDWLCCLHCELQDKTSFLREKLKSTEEIVKTFKSAWALYNVFWKDSDSSKEVERRTGCQTFKEFKQGWG